jgi:aspartate/glutamate racemase
MVAFGVRPDFFLGSHSPVKVGVLGGIGPGATGMFYCGLIRRLQERGLIRSNRDYSQIVVNSIPAPELIHDDITGRDLRPYVEGLKELDCFGVDFIVMVCNTIHLFHGNCKEKSRRQFLI